MYIDSITFWTTVLSGIIIGLVVGGIIGLAGYFIWKRQHLYSKKLDAYTTYNNLIYDFGALLNKILKCDEDFVPYVDKMDELINKLVQAGFIFAHYFNSNYLNPIQEVIKVYDAIIDNTNTMNVNDTLEYIRIRCYTIHNINFK